MEKEKLLLILHYSPPIHGASKVGDVILKSKLLKENFNTKYIKLQSSENLESIGKFQAKKIIDAIIIFFDIFLKLVFFKPKKIYFTASPDGFAFYRDIIIGLLIKLYSKIITCDIFYHYHAMGIAEFTSKSSFHKRITSFFVSNVNVILISRKIKHELEILKSYKRIIFLENGVKDYLDLNSFKEVLEKRENSKILNILFLSNIIKTKGYDTALNLVNELKNKGCNNFKFHFAGSWNSDEDKLYFNKFITEKKVEKHVQYHGLVSGEEKRKLFILANMFIFPTRYPKEVFPLSILEALSYGLPILAFDKGAVSEIIDEEVGIISNQRFIFNDFLKMKNSYINNKVSLICRQKFLEKYSVSIFEKKLLVALMLKDER